MYIGHYEEYQFLSERNKTLIFWTNFWKISNIKFYENPSSGSRVVPSGRTDGRTDGWTKSYDEADNRLS